MKKNIFLLLTSLIIYLPAISQENKVDTLLNEINQIRTDYYNLRDNKKKVEKLEKAIMLQDSVIDVLFDSIQFYSAFEEDAHAFRFFNCKDTSVFNHDFAIVNTDKLPYYLLEFYTAIQTVRQFADCIESMKKRINKAESDNTVAESDKKEYVSILIKSDIDKVNAIFDIMDGLDMSILSESQRSYYQHYSEEFNVILDKYIF